MNTETEAEIRYPKDDKFESVLACALSHPTYEAGLNWITNWEFERAYKARLAAGDGPYETCFTYAILQYNTGWAEKMKSDEVLLASISNVPGGWALASMLRDDVKIGDFRDVLIKIVRAIGVPV